MLTEQQYADVKGISKWTVRRLIEAGRLDAEDFGTGSHREYRIAPDALLRPKTQAASAPVAAAAPVGRRRRLAAAGRVSAFA